MEVKHTKRDVLKRTGYFVPMLATQTTVIAKEWGETDEQTHH
jgi:hypothetical protein